MKKRKQQISLENVGQSEKPDSGWSHNSYVSKILMIIRRVASCPGLNLWLNAALVCNFIKRHKCITSPDILDIEKNVRKPGKTTPLLTKLLTHVTQTFLKALGFSQSGINFRD